MSKYDFPLSNDYEEISSHGTESFPIAVYEMELTQNVLACTPLHWHKHMQFNLVTKGSISVNVNQKSYIIKENQGIFINASCLHSIASCQLENATYIGINISPGFFAGSESIIQKKYIQPFIQLPSIPSILFDLSIPWENEILMLLSALNQAYISKNFGYELSIYHMIYKIWFLIITNTSDYIDKVNVRIFEEDQRIKEMLTFIH
ncbi:MAG: hypothetical protein AVO33_01090 [delta proteobacterium ML8_F1]|nr:MAG: hypothetical protein AVO33_01090 [delta proteobacterium ML8_F1]